MLKVNSSLRNKESINFLLLKKLKVMRTAVCLLKKETAAGLLSSVAPQQNITSLYCSMVFISNQQIACVTSRQCSGRHSDCVKKRRPLVHFNESTVFAQLCPDTEDSSKKDTGHLANLAPLLRQCNATSSGKVLCRYVQELIPGRLLCTMNRVILLCTTQLWRQRIK